LQSLKAITIGIAGKQRLCNPGPYIMTGTVLALTAPFQIKFAGKAA
jgi:hypothetical protein